jgi:hypothetical protein
MEVRHCWVLPAPTGLAARAAPCPSSRHVAVNRLFSSVFMGLAMANERYRHFRHISHSASDGVNEFTKNRSRFQFGVNLFICSATPMGAKPVSNHIVRCYEAGFIRSSQLRNKTFNVIFHKLAARFCRPASILCTARPSAGINCSIACPVLTALLR